MGTLHTDARLSDHKATDISLKVDYDTRHAYKRKIWQYNDADTDKLNYLFRKINALNDYFLSIANVNEKDTNLPSYFQYLMKH